MLDRLDPAQRLAFVLHDMFAVSFDEIASIVGRSPQAARQLASRARRRVQGAPTVSKASLIGNDGSLKPSSTGGAAVILKGWSLCLIPYCGLESTKLQRVRLREQYSLC